MLSKGRWSRYSPPGEFEQHHDTLRLQHPVRQEASTGAESRRPGILGASDVEHRAGGRGIDPKDRRDAGDAAAEDGGGVAQLPAGRHSLAACASADGVSRPTIAGAWWMSSLSVR